MIGASCDWTRTRFTLDPAYSRAVREVFVTLWEEGLIYRGHRVIHWCPRCLTALSDEEAESKDIDGKLYFIRYHVEGGPNPCLTVATTRPETMLGDTAVAVNPKDLRHHGFVGKVARVPIIDLPVPIITDEAVEPGFGTGFVKVTPAHDATDFEIGLRHKLEMPLVMTEDGRMDHPTRVPKTLADLDRFDAREKIVDMLKERGLLEKVEPHRHGVRHCYRCDTVVEPRLSDQWFVKMKPLAQPALEAYRTGAIRLVPERWGATYEHWMENIRDWNISRQLWWGHRIPVFTCTKCVPPRQWADREDPKACPECGGPVEQDPDVLDTWFSSWLWPFATLGWPDETPDLKRFYPGHTLVTAPEILFFWVARMIMAGYHFRGDRPFATVYLHGTVRDTQHRKMSKSLGNGIDPLDVVGKFGADALRWTTIAGVSLGSDLMLDPNDLETTFAPGRNFANKLWNIGRFILAQLPERVQPLEALDALRLLHPVVPFITEELWQKLPGRTADELLAAATWPSFKPELVDAELDLQFLRVKQVVEQIRSIRAEYKVPPKTRLRASITARGRDNQKVFEAESETIRRLAQLEELSFDGGSKRVGAYAVFGDGSEVYVALEGAIDVQQECRRLSGEPVPDFGGKAVIQLDEGIDEGPGSSGGGGGGGGGTGAITGLAQKIVLSPVAGDVKVSWHRSAIHVQPGEGFKPNRVYHLEVLPGIADLRRNVTKTGTTIVFSTGGPLPQAELSGRALLWVEQRTLTQGVSRAAPLPHTVPYVTLTDSAGNFRLREIPPGRYRVWVVQDQNNNRRQDRREPFDTVAVTVDSTASAVLWAFVHDTVGPPIRTVESLDSATLRVSFSQPLD